MSIIVYILILIRRGGEIVEISQVRQQLGRLSQERVSLEKELMAFRLPMVKGSVFLQYTSCSYAGCECAKGKKHGPFYYRSLKEGGKTVQQYLGKRLDTPLGKKLLRYKDFQDRMRRMHKLDKQLAALWKQYRENLIDERGEA